MQHWAVWFFINKMQIHSTCFGRYLCPFSGVLKTVVTATGVCTESGYTMCLLQLHISNKLLSI